MNAVLHVAGFIVKTPGAPNGSCGPHRLLRLFELEGPFSSIF